MTTLKVENLFKSFGGVEAVQDCSFEVAEKKITALIGPNGAGKTTIFNLLNGFIRADRGQIIFQNHDVSHAPVWQRSRLGMSRTFQLSRVFRNLTIRDNLILAIRYDDDQFWKVVFSKRGQETKKYETEIEKIMAFVGLNKDPNIPVTELSYGEQKLFDLARALVNPHTFLLLDEPVAGINPVLRERLKQIMKKMKENKETILLIEHDMDFVESVAEWVIVMVEGRIIKEGLPQEVLKAQEVLRAYLGPDFKEHAA